MTQICPTITAFDNHDYRNQMELIKPFASRIHIDCMDGQFTPSVSPDLNSIWWFDDMVADVHLMYQQPEPYLNTLFKLKPSLVIIHYEAHVDHVKFAESLRGQGIKAGLALLQDTSVSEVSALLESFDHVLVFSGHLGYHGGTADLSLTTKVQQIRRLFPKIEIAWDGGINDQNTTELIRAGVDVLNVGGFIHSATNPIEAYAKLKTLAE